MNFPRSSRRQQRALKSRNPEQRFHAARRAMKSAALKLSESRHQITAAATLLAGTGIPKLVTDLGSSAEVADGLERQVVQLLRQLEGYE